MQKPITRTLFVLCMCFSATVLCAQAPVKIWDNTIGGEDIDRLGDACLTTDGGILLGGYSKSYISGDKTQDPIGTFDYWIVKLNADGNVLWDKTYGTTEGDYITSVAQGADGNYLVAGNTIGGISGDKTEAAFGSNDFWVLCLDPLGNILWQKTFGGSLSDVPKDILPVAEGYIISGVSASDISGNKTAPSYGADDGWVLMLNFSGEITYQASFGGLSTDGIIKTIPLNDGSYVLCGESTSGISGNKTLPSKGIQDFWLIHLTESLDMDWQRVYGSPGTDALRDVMELPDGGLMILGYSTGNIGADKTTLSANVWIDCCEVGFGDGWWSNTTDAWYLRTDSIGNLLWEQTRQIDDNEYPRTLFTSADGRYGIAGDKWSDGAPSYITMMSINDDGFMIYTNDWINGGLYAEADEGGYYYVNGNSKLLCAITLADGTCILAGNSDALAGDYKSESVIGPYDEDDLWVIKMGPDTCTTLQQYTDQDQDGIGGSVVSQACMVTPGYTFLAGPDCNDNRSSVFPGASEICDGIDNDCDGAIDEGLVSCDPGPPVMWDSVIGGENYDEAKCIIPFNGGLIVAGTTESNTGFALGNAGYKDMVVAHIEITGGLIWSAVLGGDDFEEVADIIETSDGGLLVVGSSESGVTGNKTVPQIGSTDSWLIKLSASGAIEWQNAIGGSSNDYAQSIAATPDGGYILAIDSYSGISGDKTEANFGSRDLWIVKISSVGDIEWQNSIGGDSFDYTKNVIPLTTGGYLVAAYSNSGATGEKTAPPIGYVDYWVLKLNDSGEVLWQKTFGGADGDYLRSAMETADGNILLAGDSYSGVSVYKSEASISSDIWLLEIDTAGGIIWENTISAAGFETVSAITAEPTGGFLLLAGSDGVEGYEKSEPVVTMGYLPFPYYGDHADNDYWLMHCTAEGEIHWQNTIGGNHNDAPADFCRTADDLIVCVGTSRSFSSSDKSSDNIGLMYEVFYDDEPYMDPVYLDEDMWMIALDNTCVPYAELCNSIDDDCDGLTDDGVIETIALSPSGTTGFCVGDSITITAVHSGTSLQWYRNGIAIPGAVSETLTTSFKGTYTCKTSSACDDETSAPVVVKMYKDPPAAITAAGPLVFCSGGSVLLQATAGVGLNYQWYNGPVAIPGATSVNYSATEPGAYKCRIVRNATGCNSLSNTLFVSVPCREGDELAEDPVYLFPNPATDQFNLVHNAAAQEAIIFDAFGREIMLVNLSDVITQVQIAHLPAGIYQVRVGDTFLQLVKQ